MTFWTGIAVGYVLLIAAGLALGRYLAEHFPDRGSGGLGAPAQPAPEPRGPAHAIDFCPPLGSPFDRALLPGAFDDEPATRTV